MMDKESLSLHVCECSDSLVEESNEMFGQYPILIYKNYFIPRKYILEFLSKATGLDDGAGNVTLDKEQSEVQTLLINLIQDRLNVIVKANELAQEK